MIVLVCVGISAALYGLAYAMTRPGTPDTEWWTK